MKILISIPCLLSGGTEIQTLNLVIVLVGAGYHVTVCCYYEYDDDMVLRFKATGAQVLLMKYERSSGLLHLAKGLIGLFKTERPYVVHVQYIAPGLIPVVAAKLAGIKTVFATVHQPGRVYGWKEKKILRIAAKLCTAFFCNSKSVEESWFGDSELFDINKKYNNRKHFTIYNAVDVDHIEQITKQVDSQKLRSDLGIDNKPVIGVVGRLRWEKGQDILLDAMPEVVKAIPNVKLLVIGDGPARMSLELRAKSSGLSSNILWLGQKTLEEVYQLYSIMDVVAVPSIFEGFGLTAAEAMAAGRPVVGSRVDGLAEIIEEGVTGYSVPVNNSDELAENLIATLKNSEKAEAMGINGYNRVKKEFSFEHFSNSIISAYRSFRTSERY